MHLRPVLSSQAENGRSTGTAPYLEKNPQCFNTAWFGLPHNTNAILTNSFACCGLERNVRVYYCSMVFF